MYTNLEFRGRWLDIFGNIVLIVLLSGMTLGIYLPWGYARWQRIITENTYYDDQQLEFDGSGSQVFVQFIIIGFFALITLGLYIILGFSATRLHHWRYAHTLMPNGQRMEYQGEALDLFWEKFLLFLFTPLTLGIYYFWGYNRLRRQILTSVSLDGQRLQFERSVPGLVLVVLVNWLWTIVTVGIYSLLGFATIRLFKWEMGQTLVPRPVRASTPMPVISTPVSTLTAGLPEQMMHNTDDTSAAAYERDSTYRPESSYPYDEQPGRESRDTYYDFGDYSQSDQADYEDSYRRSQASTDTEQKKDAGPGSIYW